MSTPWPMAMAVFIAGVMEHIEEAGIHSGDSACALPPHSLKSDVIAELERQTRELATALNVVGLMNVQFAMKDGTIHVLEVNPRASRTVPFVAKVIGEPIAKIAARLMAGESLASFRPQGPQAYHVGVKEAVFPFNRFPGVDILLGPEMRSTGEVMGLDRDYAIAFAKSQLGAGSKVPVEGTAFVSVKDSDKPRILPAVKRLHELGFRIIGTGGTQRYLQGHGVPSEKVNKVLEGRPHIVDAHEEWRDPARLQHHRRPRRDCRFRFDTACRPYSPHPLLYDAFGLPCRHPGDRRSESRNPRCQALAGLWPRNS